VKKTRKELATAALLAFVVTLFFADILLAGLNLYIRDIQRTYIPNRALLTHLLRSGEFPFWNPFVSAGQPLAANPAFELFYPPQWLMAFGELRTMVHLEVVLHFPVAAIGFYFLSRSLGCRRWVACLGAFSFALGGLMLSSGSIFPFLFSATWLPWIAWFFRERRFALAAIALGLLLLAADVSMIVQAGALLLAYAAYRKRDVKAAVLVIAVASLIGSAAIVPALDHQRDSGRAAELGLANATTWTLAPLRPLELIWRTAYSSASEEAHFFWNQKIPFFINFYAGMLAMIVAIAGFIRRIRGALFVGLAAAISYLTATGPLFVLLYRAGFRSVRYPEKYFVTAIFVLAVFAVIAGEEAARDRAFRRTAAIVAAVIASITAAVCAVTLLPGFDQLFASFWHRAAPDADLSSRFRAGMLTSLAIAVVATVLLAAERLSPQLRVTIAMLVVLVDLGTQADHIMSRITADYYTPPPAARALAQGPQPVRIYSHADWQRLNEPQPPLPVGIRPWILRNGLLPYAENDWGFGDIGNFDPDKTKLLPAIDYDSLLALVRRVRPDRMPLVLAMGGTTHVSYLVPLDPHVIADPRLFDEIAPVAFKRIANPRYYFATQLVGAETAEEVARKMLSNEPFPTSVAFTANTFLPSPGRVLRTSETNNRIELDVESAGRGFLALAVTPHKYWQATIDDLPARLVRANVGFQGLVVEAGRHHVAMQYRNPVVIVCGWLSLVAFMATAAASLRRKAPQPPSPH
jgi:hypothetical protein